MKYLILLLLTFNAYAEFKVKYIETATGGKYGFEKNTEAKAKKHLLKIIKKSQWMKGEWKLSPESDLVKVEEYTDAVDTGETKTIQDMEGNDVEVPVYEYIDKTRNLYYYPSNFTYSITDITAENQAIKDEKAAIKAERQAMRAILKDLDDTSPVGAWRLKVIKVLKRLIKDSRE